MRTSPGRRGCPARRLAGSSTTIPAWSRGPGTGRAVAEPGYRPNTAARTLAGGRADLVQLVVIDDDPSAFGTNPYYGRVVTGMLEADHAAPPRGADRHTATQALLHGEARPDWSRILPTDLRVRASSTG